MKKIAILICSIPFITIISNGQAPSITWQRTIGGNSFDELMSLQQTSDKGYILGGYSVSNSSGDKSENSQGMHDYWVVKVDSSGNIIWQNTIGGTNQDYLHAVEQTSDRGYIVGGISRSDSSGDKSVNSYFSYDYWIIRLDSIGTIQWQKTIGGNLDESEVVAEQTIDKGYILAGSSLSNISGDKTESCIGSMDYWLVKADSTGSIQWQNTIGGTNEEHLYSVKQTADGGLILAGHTASDSSGDKTENCLGMYDFWIIKVDSNGNIQWQNTIGGSQSDWFFVNIFENNKIIQTPDGGYIFGGTSNSNISGDKTENSMGLNDYWVLRLDSSGNILWQNTIGGSSDDFLGAIGLTSDGGFIIGGTSSSGISGDKTESSRGLSDYWVVKLDSAGNIQWDKTIGGSLDDNLSDLQQTIDGNFILGGYSKSNISGDKTENSKGQDDYWIVKISLPEANTIPEPFASDKLLIYPSPTTGNINIKSDEPIKEVKIINLLGNLIYHSMPDDTDLSLQIDSKFPGGIYFIQIILANKSETKKIVVIR